MIIIIIINKREIELLYEIILNRRCFFVINSVAKWTWRESLRMFYRAKSCSTTEIPWPLQAPFCKQPKFVPRDEYAIKARSTTNDESEKRHASRYARARACPTPLNVINACTRVHARLIKTGRVRSLPSRVLRVSH